MTLDDILGNRHKFSEFSLIDQIGLIYALHWAVGRNRNYAKSVDLLKFRGFSHRRTGHT